MQDSRHLTVVQNTGQIPSETEERPGKAQLRHATILVVDDDADVRAFTADCLRDQGHIVLEADGADAALRLVSDGALFDLALLDFAMPDMNGKELARRITSRRHQARILFLTGFGGTEELRDVQPERIIQKPYNMDELAERIEAELRGHQSRDN